MLTVMHTDSASEKELIALTKEVCLMTSLQKHENVIQLLGCSWTADGECRVYLFCVFNSDVVKFKFVAIFTTHCIVRVV